MKRAALPKKKVTGEYVLFTAIAASRPHVCFVSKKSINIYQADGRLNVSCFPHVLSKAQNKFPKFKLFEKNIVLMQPWIHRVYDQGTEQQKKELEKYPGYTELLQLQQFLTDLYNKKDPGLPESFDKSKSVDQFSDSESSSSDEAS